MVVQIKHSLLSVVHRVSIAGSTLDKDLLKLSNVGWLVSDCGQQFHRRTDSRKNECLK